MWMDHLMMHAVPWLLNNRRQSLKTVPRRKAFGCTQTVIYISLSSIHSHTSPPHTLQYTPHPPTVQPYSYTPPTHTHSPTSGGQNGSHGADGLPFIAHEEGHIAQVRHVGQEREIVGQTVFILVVVSLQPAHEALQFLRGPIRLHRGHRARCWVEKSGRVAVVGR